MPDVGRLEGFDLNLVVEVTDVADDGLILHPAHVIQGDDVLVAGGGHEDVRGVKCVFHGGDRVAFHGRLKRTNGVDFGDDHACP